MELHIADPKIDPPDPHTKDERVIPIGGVTRLSLPPDRILEGAVGALDEVVIIGWEKDSGKLYFASSVADGGDVLWLIEKAKQTLLSVG